MDIHDQVRASDVFQTLKNQSDPLLLAVSGGPDSIVLLHVFATLFDQMEDAPELYAGHVQHDLRDDGPLEDRKFVRRMAERLQVPFCHRSVEVAPVLEDRSVSPEAAARRKRYKALHDMCSETGSKTVLTAHHQDDQVETILLRLLNGTGIQGLRGIRERRSLELDADIEGTGKGGNVELVRPFLSISKQSIYDYLDEHDLSWRTDPSNENVQYRRNFVRKKLVPLVREQLGSAFPDLLLRIRKRASKLDQALRSRWQSRMMTGDSSEGGLRIKRAEVERLSPMLYPYFLRWVKKSLNVERVRLRATDFERLNALVSSGETGREEVLSDEVRIRLEHSYLTAEDSGEPKPAPPGSNRLHMPGVTEWGEYTVSITPVKNVEQSLEATRSDSWKAIVDVSSIAGTPTISSRRKGDRIRPIGFTGHKEVTDLMMDEKIPYSRRNFWPVIRDRRGVIWLPGLRLSHRVRITDYSRSKHVFLLWCKK